MRQPENHGSDNYKMMANLDANRLASLGWAWDLLDDHTLDQIFVSIKDEGYI